MRYLLLLITAFLFVQCNSKQADKTAVASPATDSANISKAVKEEERPCSDFKNGKYLIRYKSDNLEFSVDRQGESQTEYNNKTDSIAGYEVKWMNDCEYHLKKIYTKKLSDLDTSGKKTIFELLKQLSYKVRILTGTKDYYVFEIQNMRHNLLYSDTAWVVK